MEKEIILTGDRPTGRLHLGHYVGSLKKRVELQETDRYEMYIMIADAQALTDNYDNVSKVSQNIIEVALDYLAVGIDPDKVTIFIQSMVKELYELCFYYMNLVTIARLQRNPTVKQEVKLRGFNSSTIPVGFFTYPISQAADITAFDATCVPVGEDQLPMLEQTREIVRAFNNLYGKTLVEPKELIPEKGASRLIGTDGKAKMSKSLGNCIYLSDDDETIRKQVMSMYTDPNHLKVEDPGQVEGNVVFIYLDVFSTTEHFKKYCPEYNDLQEMKDHYTRGGLGDVKIKKFLIEVLKELITPIRQRREELSKDKKAIYDKLFQGSLKASQKANETLERVRKAMAINYFDNI